MFPLAGLVEHQLQNNPHLLDVLYLKNHILRIVLWEKVSSGPDLSKSIVQLMDPAPFILQAYTNIIQNYTNTYFDPNGFKN